MATQLTNDQIGMQDAIARAARNGLHHTMAVYAENSSGRRFGLVEVCTHPHHDIVVRTDGGSRFELVDDDHCVWKPASIESLGPVDYETCMLAAIAMNQVRTGPMKGAQNEL